VGVALLGEPAAGQTPSEQRALQRGRVGQTTVSGTLLVDLARPGQATVAVPLGRAHEIIRLARREFEVEQCIVHLGLLT
jgi:hypothetical protein